MRLICHFRYLLLLSVLALCPELDAQTPTDPSTTLGDLLQRGPGIDDLDVGAPNNKTFKVLENPVTGIVSPSDHSVMASQWYEQLIRPKVLRAADEPADQLPSIAPVEDHTSSLFRATYDYPYGFTGPSGILRTESQTSNHFIPVEDRWPSDLGRLPWSQGRLVGPFQPKRVER